ncbi:glycoside hydrolase family 127 protein [Pseudolysinimonas kribbensis]
MTDTSATTLAGHGRPIAPSRGVLRPLGLDEVTITGGFWGDRQRVNGTALIQHCEEWVERIGWAGNFDAAVEGRMPGAHTGKSFADSDVYKLMEAMAWEIGRTGDAEMDGRFRALTARIARAQEPDGYLNTNFGRPGQAPRYSDLEWGHELYSYGHLIQAGIARARTTGEDEFVQIVRRVADHVCEAFGPDGIQSVDGHPEIEVALAEWSRYTGDPKYLAQARLFIERRGHGVLGDIEFGRSYFQDDVPVREATVLRGHAVRALYLTAGAVDVAVEDDDAELLDILRSQMSTTVARRTYLTGGMGAHHEGESFGLDHELPPDRSYSETCAGIASIMVHHRMLLATGEEGYGDLVERMLFNVVAASPAEDGRSFFYTNTLHQREPGAVPPPDVASPRASSSLRAPWFNVSCCPTNVARTFASLGAYLASVTDDGIQLHQYAPAMIATALGDGSAVALHVDTDYPRTGSIRVTVDETREEPWALTLRVPAWAEGATVAVAGSDAVAVPTGAHVVERSWAAGDVVELELPMQPRWTRPDPRVDAVRGSVAVERGPLVMALESVDLGTSVNDVIVRSDQPLVDHPAQFDGEVSVTVVPEAVADAPWPYANPAPSRSAGDARSVKLIPYYRWARRGPSTMRVWLPEV